MKDLYLAFSGETSAYILAKHFKEAEMHATQWLFGKPTSVEQRPAAHIIGGETSNGLFTALCREQVAGILLKRGEPYGNPNCNGVDPTTVDATTYYVLDMLLDDVYCVNKYGGIDLLPMHVPFDFTDPGVWKTC